MYKMDIEIRHLLLAIASILIASSLNTATAQDQRWIRVGETQCFFKDFGSQPELTPENFLTWPAQYGDRQTTTRSKCLWIGAKNFNDPVEKKVKSVKVIGAGHRLPANQFTMIFPQGIKLMGRYYHPTVVVDDKIGTSNTLYDELDEQNDQLPCDRMIVSKFITSMGVSVTRKILAFTQQNHDNYFIQDFVFKNTGIYNAEGDVLDQTLQEFRIYFSNRYAFAGVTSLEWGSTWGSFGSQWGTSTLLHNFDQNSPEGIRGFYSWYGPTNSWGHTPTPAEDWGCPDWEETGVLGSAKYTGVVTLFASKSPEEFATDDVSQPRTTAYTGSDGAPFETAVSQYEESFMQQRYQIMNEGRLDHSQSEAFFKAVGNDGYVEDWTEGNTYRNTHTTGGSSQGQGFGPYTLAPGDSIRIVFAEGVSGISWQKCREVGANWYAYYKDFPNKPELIMPDKSVASEQNKYGFSAFNAYKRAWCETGIDSILQTLRNAIANYQSGYNIPQPPPAPSSFTVQSGGDRIRLSWANNATSDPHFNGYVIYRSEGNVKDYRTVYKKIFECNNSNVVHSYDDTSAVRGFNYYYYIQSKDDGTQNDVEPGKPLYSSLYLTLTSEAAYLRRPAGTAIEQVRVVPNPYDIRARIWQFGDQSQYDRIAFYGLPPVCKVKVFTERGDLIWEKDHINGTGDELWSSLTSSGQIIVSGIYILYVEVTEDFYNPETNELQFSKGEAVYRKFVVIR